MNNSNALIDFTKKAAAKEKKQKIAAMKAGKAKDEQRKANIKKPIKNTFAGASSLIGGIGSSLASVKTGLPKLPGLDGIFKAPAAIGGAVVGGAAGAVGTGLFSSMIPSVDDFFGGIDWTAVKKWAGIILAIIAIVVVLVIIVKVMRK